jgi:hypothetical protein
VAAGQRLAALDYRMTRLPNAEIYLVPLGRGRFDLYTEPADDESSEVAGGFLRTRLVRLQQWWQEAASRGKGDAVSSDSRVGRWRDRMVCRMAEMVAEHRTLWSLRGRESAVLVYPADHPEQAALAARDRLLTRARRHHAVWSVVDGLLFIASGVFMFVPGPNVIAYYFGLRLVVHFLAWRGAGHALDRIAWSAHAEPALAELGRLAGVARDERASRVEAIAAALHVPRLAAFFDRSAIPVR